MALYKFRIIIIIINTKDITRVVYILKASACGGQANSSPKQQQTTKQSLHRTTDGPTDSATHGLHDKTTSNTNNAGATLGGYRSFGTAAGTWRSSRWKPNTVHLESSTLTTTCTTANLPINLRLQCTWYWEMMKRWGMMKLLHKCQPKGWSGSGLMEY